MPAYLYNTSGSSAASSSRYNVYVPPGTVSSSRSASSLVKRSTSCSAPGTPAPSCYALYPASYSKENCSIRGVEPSRRYHRSSSRRTREPEQNYYVSAVQYSPSSASVTSASSSRQSRSTDAKPLKSSFRRSHSADKHVHFPDQRPAAPQRPVLKQSHTWHAGDFQSTPRDYAVHVPLDHASHHAPKPPTTSSTPLVDMHPLFTSTRLHNAPISYDITYAPSASSVLDRKTHAPVAGATLAQPATEPAVPVTSRLVLTSHKFPWAVVVNPSSAGGRHTHTSRSTPITNLDVLHAVHSTLAKRVTAEEWNSLGADSMVQRKVRKAYEKRCKKLGGGWEGGVRRIDWLHGKTRLAGVEVDKNAGAGASGVCRLVFASPKD
ncbi:hypothetical protein PUNSTDRAFT_143829 [Punctularia strigosozonata HHB-11173 SS5]|uniref:uncharacterized protein n=1 Tax=Punctularia strigosozonata (strain HHB-11173) TaxID=741275 RepID=UPI000441706E|nr:uncharacterized protein PUNSTDRAFT_143829 [Punctularia strigosozonata HHB-11173 SS5]EIN08143.1 hypothetical protein PUNSTDRAFT_143829 [Punctularia strigosozonata HHB-11173 SS5]